MTTTASEPKILIIGAGPSGIACATKLLDYGFEDITLLEAESRIGGRIHTIPFADNVIDLGAQWCHGEQNNLVYDLAQKHNLLETTGDIYENYRCVRSNRDVLPENIAQRLKHIVNSSLITRQKELIDYKGSLGDYLTHKFYSELSQPANSDIEPQIAREFFENYKKFESSVEAADTLDDVSGVGYLEYAECEGDLLLNWKDKGFAEFLRLLLQCKELGTEQGVLEGRIKFGKQVKRIFWQRIDAKTLVHCTDGEQLLADHVILTVSLGVLQSRLNELFEPKLPNVKQNAINGLAFGTVNKIFIEFPTKFWPDDWTGFTFLWRDEDLCEIRETNRAWLEDVFGFYSVSYQPRILSGWIVGASARYMETLPKSEILAGCLYLFRRFLPWTIPEPVSFITSAWFSNVNFRGSYSFRSMKSDEVGASAKALAEPLTFNVTSKVEMIGKINGNLNHDDGQNHLDVCVESNDLHCDQKPVLQFGGEASSEHYYSTVHGAVEAGWREAERLADFYGISNDTKNMRKSKL